MLRRSPKRREAEIRLRRRSKETEADAVQCGRTAADGLDGRRVKGGTRAHREDGGGRPSYEGRLEDGRGEERPVTSRRLEVRICRRLEVVNRDGTWEVPDLSHVPPNGCSSHTSAKYLRWYLSARYLP